jgi:hypothetical protein
MDKTLRWFIAKLAKSVRLFLCFDADFGFFKGRTGLMICCFLIYSGKCQTANEALQLFGTKRTINGQVCLLVSFVFV